MSEKSKLPGATEGYGWVGAWNDDEELGWWMPRFLHRFNRRGNTAPHNHELDEYEYSNRVYLCKIKVVPVTDKNGRPITRIVKGTRDE